MAEKENENKLRLYGKTAILLIVFVVLPCCVLFNDSLPDGLKNIGSRLKKGFQAALFDDEEELPEYREHDFDMANANLDPLDSVFPLSNGKNDDLFMKYKSGNSQENHQHSNVTPNRQIEIPDVPSMGTTGPIPREPEVLPMIEPESVQEPDYLTPSLYGASVPLNTIPPAIEIGSSEPSIAHAYDSFEQEPSILQAGLNDENPMPELGSTVAGVGKYSELEDQLQKMGAIYYRLETWGDRDAFFKFSCYVPNPKDPNHHLRHFQAVEADDVQAIKKVIREIQTWQIMK